MRVPWTACLVLAATAAPALAQRVVAPRGSIVGGSPARIGAPSGFGNVVFPSTGGAPGSTRHLFGPYATHAQRLGATISGNVPFAHGSQRFRGGFPAVYAVPVYVGDYGSYYAPPAAPVYQMPPQQQSPTVIINQYYTPDRASPVMRDYSERPLPEASPRRLESYQAPAPAATVPAAEEKATVYLIALKDGTIHAAYGYWLEKDTLNYITTQGSHNRVSFELVNVEFSTQLNRERSVEFKIE
jgi:hypothetical protein